VKFLHCESFQISSLMLRRGFLSFRLGVTLTVEPFGCHQQGVATCGRGSRLKKCVPCTDPLPFLSCNVASLLLSFLPPTVFFPGTEQRSDFLPEEMAPPFNNPFSLAPTCGRWSRTFSLRKGDLLKPFFLPCHFAGVPERVEDWSFCLTAGSSSLVAFGISLLV